MPMAMLAADRAGGIPAVAAMAVVPEFRRQRAGRALMEAARELYATLGFVETAPYYYNPIPGSHYLKVDL